MIDTSESALVDYEPEVVADAATAAAIARAGGRLFVWADEAGFEHVSALVPVEQRQFKKYPGDGFTLFADAGVYPPRRWIVKRRRLRSGCKVLLDWQAPSKVGDTLLDWIFRALFSRP
jgi:hypothetical protein